MTRYARSLRSRLLTVIILPLLAVVVLLTGWRYYESKEITQPLYDNALLSIAHVIVRDVVLQDGDVLAESLLETLTQALGDQIFYQIAGENNPALITGYTAAPTLPDSITLHPGKPVFYDQHYRGDPVRVVLFREFISAAPYAGWVKVQVWQRTGQRELLRINLTRRALTIMTLLTLAAAIVTWFGIHYGLRPLHDLQAAIEKRSPDDISPIKRRVPREVASLVSAMNALFGQLRAAMAEKDVFISNAAHQLRNPIAGLLSQAEAAERTLNPAELPQRVADVAEAARRTARLTEQLLSMERVSPRLQLQQFVSVDLSGVVRDVLVRLAARALNQGVELSLSGADQPVLVQGNALLLSEALDNLLDNALRYGCPQGGSVDVHLNLLPESVCLTLQDNGKGIPQELQTRIFERFVRGAEDGSDGCGLGLAIAKSIIEGHRGTISLSSGEGGTCIRCCLPVGVRID